MLEPEIWKPVSEFPDRYEISSYGRVRSRVQCKTGRILKLQDGGGYLKVCFCVDQKIYNRRINRLVCEAFHGPPPFKDADALHKNGDNLDNTPGNLYWGTHQQNMDDMKRSQPWRERHVIPFKGLSQ